MGYDDRQTVDALAPVIDLLKQLMHGKRALEIACGHCFWTHHISEAATSIVATDFNESTLDQARQKPLDWNKIVLQQADAYQLSSISQSFDGAYSVDWFAHVPRFRFHEFLRGLHRRLEIGAQVAFCDQLPKPGSMTHLYDDEGNHLQERRLPDGSLYRVIKHYLTDDEITALFSVYTEHVEIARLPECQRLVVSYVYRGPQP